MKHNSLHRFANLITKMSIQSPRTITMYMNASVLICARNTLIFITSVTIELGQLFMCILKIFQHKKLNRIKIEFEPSASG